MVHNEQGREQQQQHGSIFSWIGRLILVAIVLGITSFLTPGFSIQGLWSFLIAAVVITFLDSLADTFMGTNASPLGRGIKGFVISAIIIYIAQYLVPHMSVSIIGAMLAAVVIGIFDAVLPGKIM